MAVVERFFEYINKNVDSSVRSTGWRMVNTPTFDPMPIAYGVTHDVLEHFEADDNGIEQEMLAFGSIYHIRVRGGWWSHYRIPAAACQMMAWDMARFLHETDFTIKVCDSGHTKRLDSFHVKALSFYMEWLTKRTGMDNTHPDMLKALRAFEQACHWMAVGYDRSLSRWKGHTPKALCELFNSITGKIEGVVGEHGSKLKVMFDTLSLSNSVVKLD